MIEAYGSRDEYAISTYMFEHEPLESAFRAIAENNFSHIELWADTVHLDPRVNPNVRQVEQWMASWGLHAHALHTPFRNFPHFADELEGRGWRLNLWKRSIDIAAELGVPIAVIHALNRQEYNYTYQDVLYLHELLYELSEYAVGKGILLALENIPSAIEIKDEVLCTLGEQIRLFGGIPNLYWCLDIGHVTLTCNDMKNEIDSSFNRLVSMHIHNNDGIADLHDIPDQGVIDWPYWYKYLHSKGYKGKFVLEICSGTDSYNKLRTLGKLFDRRGHNE